MRTTEDALRSIKQYVSLILGEDWEVRLWDEEGTEHKPFAVVTGPGSTLYSGPAMWQESVQPVVVHVYPVPGATVEESALLAMRAQEVLTNGFLRGVGLGRPWRVPLYDYEGRSLSEGSTKRHPSDYLRVLDFSTERLPDVQFETVIPVVVNLRVAWRRVGAVPSGGKVVTEIAVNTQAS